MGCGSVSRRRRTCDRLTPPHIVATYRAVSRHGATEPEAGDQAGPMPSSSCGPLQHDERAAARSPDRACSRAASHDLAFLSVHLEVRGMLRATRLAAAWAL